jgi:N-acetylglucosaminyldiphosphoundecaprenol N-acetyl-beta-D-mannosaminyltransferase
VRYKFLGVAVDNVTAAEALERIDGFVASKTPHQVATVNPEFVMTARRNHAFRRTINNSDLAVADGVGLLFMGRLTGKRLRERVTGADLTLAIAQLGAQKGWRIFLLGAKEGVAAEAAAQLQARYPGLTIAGTLASRPSEMDNDEICKVVESAKPDVLLVGYGAPLQDLWISRNQQRLQIPVAIGVGGTFDFIAGTTKRAPKWMQQTGLEWFWRLLQEPWRWRRMLALPKFVVLSLLEATGLISS